MVPRASLPSLLNALSRRAAGKSAYWLPFEEAHRELAAETRQANGREEASIGGIGTQVKRGIFHAIATISASASSISDFFSASALIRKEMLAVVREAGGGVALLQRRDNHAYERLDRPGELFGIEPAPASVDAFADAVRNASAPASAT